MAENTTDKKPARVYKSPVGSAVLSMIFPGAGFFYAGNIARGFAYMFIEVALLQLAIYGEHTAIFILMSVGFYLFQVIDSNNYTNKINLMPPEERPDPKDFNLSMAVSIFLVTLGVLLLLANLEILVNYDNITRLWPLLLIGLGGKFIFGYLKDKGDANE